MTTSLTTGPDKVTISRSLQLSRTGSPLTDSANFTWSGTTLTNGTAAGQADLSYYSPAVTIAAGGKLILALNNLTDPYGNVVNFARIKRAYLAHNSASLSSTFAVGAGGIVAPSTAPSLTQQASGGGLSNGTYLVAYSWATAVGETQISPTASIVVNGGGSSQQITLAAITLPTVPAGVTGFNVYVSLASTGVALAKLASNQTGSYVATALPATSGAGTPQTNTALTTTPAKLWFMRADDALKVNNGEVFFKGTDPGATGFALSGSNVSLCIVNLDGTNALTLDVCLDGCSA